jgi:hypothetical protein
MKTLKVVVAIALMGVLCGVVPAIAQPGCEPYIIPKSDPNFTPEVHHHLINYQGKLVDYQGKLVHDTLSITFSIYADSVGGIPLWWETQPAVIIWGGIYNVLLGSATQMPDTLFSNDPVSNWFDRWLGIQIGAQSEMKPRQRIAIVGHSTNSDMLDGYHYTALMQEVMKMIEAMDWGRPQRTCSLYEGNCLPDCDTFRPLIDIYVNEVGPDTMEYDGPTPTFQVFNDGSGVAVAGSSNTGYGGKFTSVDEFGLYAKGAGGAGSGAALFEGDVEVTGNMGIGPWGASNNVSLLINSTEPHLIQAQSGFMNRFEVEDDGQTVITHDGSGDQGNIDDYGLVLHSRSQGMWINLYNTGYGDHPNSDHNYITFSGTDSGPVRGRIEGEDAGDVAANWQYWYENLVGGATIGVKTAIVAADGVNLASSIGDARACMGPFPCVTVPHPLRIAAATVGLAASVFDLATEVANLAIYNATYLANLGVAFSSGSGDYAEWLEKIDENETIRPGDIVGVFGGKITKSTKGAQQIMPVSTSPIVVGNMPQENEEHLYEKVAFMGQVPVKVIGPVKEGDYIIPSGLEDGTGLAVSPEFMTADEFSRVVGRAWSNSENPALNVINIVIGVNSGDVASIVKRQESQNNELRSQVEDLSQRMAQLEKTLENVAGKALENEQTEGIETAQNTAVGD